MDYEGINVDARIEGNVRIVDKVLPTNMDKNFLVTCIIILINVVDFIGTL